MFRTLCKSYIPVHMQNTLLGQHWKKTYSPSTMRIDSFTKPRSDLGTALGKRLKFKRSVSKFDHIEESGLRIRISKKDFFSDAMGIEEAAVPPPSTATDLYLNGIGPSQILVFDPDNYPGMSNNACSFLNKLRIVAVNNAQLDEAPLEEKCIDTMAVKFMEAVDYEDGRNLRMYPCELELSVGDENFTVSANREGRRGAGIVWVMQANKHIGDTRYKLGDIQLASCMIAAYQDNAIKVDGVYPERMMAIKVTGDKVHFYSMGMTASYLKDLTRGAPGEDIKVSKYPGETGLRISVPEDRKKILSHLWSMRCYAVKLDKIDLPRRTEFSHIKGGLQALTG